MKHYPRELRAWALLAVPVGVAEGEVAGVVVKNLYAGTVDGVVLNHAVALVAGAPAIANVLSTVWSTLAHGRDKIRFLFVMQVLCAASLLLVALAPVSSAGLLLLTAGFVATRLFWSAVITVRAAVWRANYPRAVRANITGRLSVMSALLMMLAGLGTGLLMRVHVSGFRWMYPLAACFGLLGAVAYRRLRVRGHRSLIEEERRSGGDGGERLLAPFSILRSDPQFRRFMFWMAIFGSGNLMLTAPLIVSLSEHFALQPLVQLLVTSSLPLAVATVSVPLWAAYFDRVHVVAFRAWHSWSYAGANLAFCLALMLGSGSLLWLGSLLLGVATGGGMIAWNLGHNDYAPPGRANQYMGVHVTLNGLRGLVAPFLGIALYEWLERRQPGGGRYGLLLPLALNTIGALGFVRMARSRAVRPAGLRPSCRRRGTPS